MDAAPPPITISEIIYLNAVVIAVFLVLVGVVMFVIAYAIGATMKSLQMYRSLQSASHSRNANDNSSKNRDDETYNDADDEKERQGPNAEYGNIQTQLAKLARLYRPYNQEISQYVMNVRRSTPDDIIDRRILSRRYDEYDYNKKDDGRTSSASTTRG